MPPARDLLLVRVHFTNRLLPVLATRTIGSSLQKQEYKRRILAGSSGSYSTTTSSAFVCTLYRSTLVVVVVVRVPLVYYYYRSYRYSSSGGGRARAHPQLLVQYCVQYAPSYGTITAPGTVLWWSRPR